MAGHFLHIHVRIAHHQEPEEVIIIIRRKKQNTANKKAGEKDSESRASGKPSHELRLYAMASSLSRHYISDTLAATKKGKENKK